MIFGVHSSDEVIENLNSERRRLEGRVRTLESELAQETLRANMEMANAARIKNNYDLTKRAMVPYGDEEIGYRCPTIGCRAHIAEPFKQSFCPYCGVRFDWVVGKCS